MGFICNGRYVVSPVESTDTEKYIDLLHDCMEETYGSWADSGFMARRRAGRDEDLAELRADLARPDVRAFLAYENPGWTTTDSGLSCSVSSAVDWSAPVGLVMSGPGPMDWESEMPVQPVPQGLRDLNQLYTRASTYGTGLGQALLDIALEPGKPAYLWYIKDNDRAVAFYEKNGFVDEGVFGKCGGSWAVPEGETGTQLYTGRMFRNFTLENQG